jgi:LAO/AO transport system kinase
MPKRRKPEWAPDQPARGFASSVMEAVAPSPNVASRPKDPSRFDLTDLRTLEQGIRAGDRTLLSRGITLIESNLPKHFEPGQELIKRLLPASGDSIRVGITGVPGAGKSTFIESFGLWLIQQGHKVAVLAVDPSSSLSRGSILGDKTRMERLSRDPGSFIRPSPSSGALGGVARKTRESIILCEAAGYDIILIETVGVGQSEIAVRSMVDFFLLMQIPGAGDELQGIKKGIMELADLIAVNKADGENVPAAELACRELNNALHYLRHATKGWQTKAVTCSAVHKTGLAEIWNAIAKFVDQGRLTGVFEERRQQQIVQWFDSLLSEAVLNRFYADPLIRDAMPDIREQVQQGKLPVVMAVKNLLDKDIQT